MYSEEMTEVFKEAFKKSVEALKEDRKEDFYFYVFIFDEGLRPYFSAWSKEAYEKSLVEDEVAEKDKAWWKWDFADSPYCAYRHEEFFAGSDKLLAERESEMDEEYLYDHEWYTRMDSMTEALKRLEEEGFFGIGEDRESVVINVEQAPPDGKERERAAHLNPPSDLLDEYLDICEDAED